VVSTRDADGPGDVEFRSFRIVGGDVTEEEVRIDSPNALARTGSREACGGSAAA
jgi:hypothetical protein